MSGNQFLNAHQRIRNDICLHIKTACNPHGYCLSTIFKITVQRVQLLNVQLVQPSIWQFPMIAT